MELLQLAGEGSEPAYEEVESRSAGKVRLGSYMRVLPVRKMFDPWRG